MQGLIGYADAPPQTGLSAISQHSRDAVSRFPDEMRAELLDDAMQWLDSFRKRLKAGRRDAVILYPKLMHMLGEERNLAILVVNTIGAQPDYARRAVETMRQAEGTDPDHAARRCAEYLASYCAARSLPLTLPPSLVAVKEAQP